MLLMAKKLTSFFIHNQVIKEEEKDIYEYCFQIFISSIANFGTIFLISIITGRFLETVYYIIGFFILRSQTGGYHTKTHFRCYILTVIMYLIFRLIINWIFLSWSYWMTLILFIVSFVIMWLFAPISDRNKPFDADEFKKYKRNSRIIIILFTIIYTLCSFKLYKDYGIYILSLCLGNVFAAVSILMALFSKYKNKEF